MMVPALCRRQLLANIGDEAGALYLPAIAVSKRWVSRTLPDRHRKANVGSIGCLVLACARPVPYRPMPACARAGAGRLSPTHRGWPPTTDRQMLPLSGAATR